MNVLILHHFSDYWESGLKNFDTTFEKELAKVLDYLRNEDIDKVILPLFEQHQLEECHYPLAEFCQSNGIELEVHEYNYAWSKESDPHGKIYTEENFGITWCYGTRDHHGENDVVEIEKWQWELVGNKVYIAGSFEDECVLDLTTALDAINTTLQEKSLTEITTHNVLDLTTALDTIGVQYEREEGLIVGSCVEYEFRGQDPCEIQEEMQEKIDEIGEEVEEKISEAEEIFNVSISEIEELHEYESEFVKSVEDRLNEIYDEYEEEVKFHNFLLTHDSMYVITDDMFAYQENSTKFQTESDKYNEHKLTKEIYQLKQEFEEYDEYIDVGEMINENEIDSLNLMFDKLTKLYKEYESEFEVDMYDIPEHIKMPIFEDIWDSYLKLDEELPMATINFLKEKEVSIKENKIKNKIKRS